MIGDVQLFTIVVDDNTLRKLLESKGFPVGRNALPTCHLSHLAEIQIGIKGKMPKILSLKICLDLFANPL